MKFKIEKISIENYKGIENLTLSNLSKVNIFVGANNTKKTTILEGIYIGASYYDEFSGIYTANTRDLIISQDKVETMFYNLNIEKEIKIKTFLNNRDNYEVIYSDYKSIPVQNNVHYSTELAYTVKKNEKVVYSTVTGVRSDGSLYSNLKNGEKKILENKISYVSSRKKWDEIIIQKFNNIKLMNNKRKLVEIISKIDDNIVDLEEISNVIYAGIKGIPKMIPLKLMGDGIYNLFNIGLTIYGSKIILIDEIENGMHYYALQHLLKEILERAEKGEYQLFITTHSIDTLNAIRDILQFSKDDMDISFINLRNKKDKLETKIYKKNEFLKEMYQGWDIR